VTRPAAQHYQQDETKPHPARYSLGISQRIAQIVQLETTYPTEELRILDPFAGVGGIHVLNDVFGHDTVGVEIEPEWAEQHPRNIVGDSRSLDFPARSFDAVVTSPCYGNRMADTYDGRDGSKRITYRTYLGRELSAGSAGSMQWGDAYRELHLEVYAECRRLLKPGGLMVVNMSDHIRDGKRIPVVVWHIEALSAIGFDLEWVDKIETRRMRQGANGEKRVKGEHLIVTRRPAE
jgi:DNA modification methylase